MGSLNTIFNISGLELLALIQCRLAENSLINIDKLTYLKTIYLIYNTRLGVKDLKAIAKLKNLEELYMQSCKLSYDKIRELLESKSLRKLEANGNKLSQNEKNELRDGFNLEYVF